MQPSLVPAEPGFRLRGRSVSRLETFVDAAFAFSLTLLVIFQDDLPGNVLEMREALRRVPTFATCFVLLGMFWAAHNRWSRRFGLEDSRSTVLSMGFVLVVLVYVYPLRMVVSAGLAILTGGWVPSELAGLGADRLFDVQTVFMVYSAGFGLLAWILWALNAHARRHADALALDRFERHQLDTEIGMHRLMALSAFASILASALALAIGSHHSLLASLPMWVYAVMGALIPLHHSRRERLTPRLEAGG